MLRTRSISLSCQISEKPTSGKGQFSVRALGQFQFIFQIPVKLLSLLTTLGLIWIAQDPLYPSMKSEIRKTQNPSRSIFSVGGGMQFSAEKSDLGQSMRNLISVPVDLVRGKPDL